MNKNIYGIIDELKENDYKNSLAIVSIIELLIEKNILSRKEIAEKAKFLDSITSEQIKTLH